VVNEQESEIKKIQFLQAFEIGVKLNEKIEKAYSNKTLQLWQIIVAMIFSIIIGVVIKKTNYTPLDPP